VTILLSQKGRLLPRDSYLISIEDVKHTHINIYTKQRCLKFDTLFILENQNLLFYIQSEKTVNNRFPLELKLNRNIKDFPIQLNLN